MPGARRDEDPRVGGLVDEQAASRRVATLVARGVSPDEIFSAVSDEVGRLFGAEAAIARFEADGSAMVVVGLTQGIPVVSIGTRWELEDFLASTVVYRTGRPARNDHVSHRNATGPVADSLREMNFVSTVAAPIVVQGHPWGVMTVSDEHGTLPPETEQRIERFTELVSTAIANAESRSAFCRLVEEQAALRRVATQVASGLSPDEIFNAVSSEVSRVLGCEQAVVERFEADGSGLIIVGAREDSRIGSIGDRWPLEDFLASTAVHRTGRPARIDLAGARNASGPVARRVREIGFISTAAAPIVVAGSLWGVIAAADTKADLPRDTEARLEHFAELVTTAIASAETRAELAASGARTRDLLREQAALRRVATLVAEGTNARDLFAAVTQEVADLFGVHIVGLHRFESDGTFTMMGIAGETKHTVGERRAVEDVAIAAMILATGRPAQKEYDTAMLGPHGAVLREHAIGVPILVGGSLWGFIAIAGKPGDQLPAPTEQRLARFTELVATAIADSDAREHIAQLAEEQAALRRVAELVAREASQTEIFTAIAKEIGQLLSTDEMRMMRYEGGRDAVVIASAGQLDIFPVGSRWPLEGDNVASRVYQSGQPARIDDYRAKRGTIAEGVRSVGIRGVVGTPILVQGQVWGTMLTATVTDEPLPPDTGSRLGQFTELMATAIANAEARAEVERLADEQAALRRVATLVAQGAPSAAVFNAVAAEMSQVLGADGVMLGRYEPDNEVVVLAHSGSDPRRLPAVTRVGHHGEHVTALVRASKQSARIEHHGPAPRAIGTIGDDPWVRASVGAPIVVDGRLWGVAVANWRSDESPPADTEDRMANFAELIDTAIANADSRDQLTASRMRLLTEGDEARRRIERDLHDGAQQRLVTLAVALRRAEAKIPSRLDELRADVSRVAEGLTTAVEELREMSRGIHPSVLTEGGLSPALKALARRSAVRVKLDLRCDDRLADQIEVAAYYTVSEALTNASKHAAATRVWVTLYVQQDALHLSIRDDGVGGADPSRGSGLIGLRDRIEALGGTIQVESSPAQGSRITATIPLSSERATVDNRGRHSA